MSDVNYWIVLGGWIALVLIAVIIELETFDLVSIWFAAGGIAALVFFFLDYDLLWQAGAFAVVSALGLLILKMLGKTDRRNHKTIPTNIDAWRGVEVRVTKDFDQDGLGEVKHEGKIWTAKCMEKSQFKVDDLVRIVKVEGNKIIVKE